MPPIRAFRAPCVRPAGRLRRPLGPAAGLAVMLAVSASCSPVGTAIGAGAMVVTAAAEERGLEGAAADVRIRVAVLERYQLEGVLFQGIGITVFDRRVLLTGEVEDATLRDRAVHLARLVEGVTEVLDEVRVTTTPEEGMGPRDALIEADLRRAIMFDAEVLAINYAIEVEDGIVYLLGVAQSDAERRRVVAHARGLSYVRAVVDHVRLKTDPRRGAPARGVVRVGTEARS